VSPGRLLDGHEIMTRLQIEPGPRIGELVEAVREAQADGVVNTREEALQFLQRLAK